MKTCGYCGRENEDSAIVCRECGQSEFSETAEEKTPAMEVQATGEAEPELPEPDVASGQEAAICPFCLFPNLPDREWCKSCGSPFNASVMDPFQSALASGSMWRGVVRGRPKLIVFIAIWIWFAPVFIAGAISVLAGLLSGVILLIGLGLWYVAVSSSMLFQVTRNLATIPKLKLDK